MNTMWLFMAKGRKKSLYGQIRECLKPTLHEFARHKGCRIVEGYILIGHVHMCIAIPPKYAVSDTIGWAMVQKTSSDSDLLCAATAPVSNFLGGNVITGVLCFVSKVKRNPSILPLRESKGPGYCSRLSSVTSKARR